MFMRTPDKKNSNLPESFPVSQFYNQTQATGFNIEAGEPGKALRPGAIWVNLAMPVDISIATGITLTDIDRIAEEKGYPLKEMAINEYDELKVNLATLLIMTHYLKEGRRLVGKNENDTLEFVVHTHRNSSAIFINKLIADMLMQCVPNSYEATYETTCYTPIDNKTNQLVIDKVTNEPLKVFTKEITMLSMPKSNAVIHFRRGFNNDDLKDNFYKTADVLFSYSIVGGLSVDHQPGSLLMPQTFIPFNQDTLSLFVDRTYTVSNHLTKELNKVLAQDQKQYLPLMEKFFNSQNKNKPFKARVLTNTDFTTATLVHLELNKLFHPVEKDGEAKPMVKVVREEPVMAFQKAM